MSTPKWNIRCVMNEWMLNGLKTRSNLFVMIEINWLNKMKNRTIKFGEFN